MIPESSIFIIKHSKQSHTNLTAYRGNPTDYQSQSKA